MSAIKELVKTEIRRSFTSASNSYDSAAHLQRLVGQELLDRYASEITGGNVMDIGCGTGFLSAKLLNEADFDRVIALDLVIPMLQMTRRKLQEETRLQFVCADAEALPFRDNSIEIIISNLAMQWCGCLDAVFNDFRRILVPGGKLIFSTFGPQTLHELKLAWKQADSYTHVNHFYSTGQIIAALQNTGMEQVAGENQLYTRHYIDVITLMKELKSLGAQNVNRGRNHNLTGKRGVEVMSAAYEKYRKQGLLPATYEVIFITAVAET